MLATDPTKSLQEWLEQHSQALGATVLKRFGLKLPFLFKACVEQSMALLSISCATALLHKPVLISVDAGFVCGNSAVHSISS